MPILRMNGVKIRVIRTMGYGLRAAVACTMRDENFSAAESLRVLYDSTFFIFIVL